jgi:uncharacterized membrane protein
MQFLKNNFWLLLLLALSLLTVLPLLELGFFIIHDNTQVQRVFEMRRALLDGMFPVRWVPDLGYGYGYPLFNFYGPLAYYFGGILTILGLNALDATKVMVIFAGLLSGLSMYLMAKEFWGKSGAFISAVLYVFAPYQALNIYVRGDFGETWAYAFIPLIFYGLLKFDNTSKFGYLIMGSIAYFAVITSHNLSALMISPFVLAGTVLLFIKSRKISLFLIPVLGILLAAFYWLPTLLEMKYTDVLSTIGGKADFRDHFVCLRQLWDSPWMYGGSIPGCIDGMSFRIGKLHIILSLIAFVTSLVFLKKYKEKVYVSFLLFLGFMFSIFLLISHSRFLWEVVPYMNFFQYPWRFLLLASFFSSLLSGSLLWYLSRSRLNDRSYLIATSILAISIILLYSKLFAPQEILFRDSDDYTNKEYLNWTTSRISDEYMPPDFLVPESSEEIVREKIKEEGVVLVDVKDTTDNFSAKLISDSDKNLLVRIPYFPAWQYSLNGEKINVEVSNSGVLVPISKGESYISAKFVQTPVEKFGNLVSLSGVVMIIVGIIYARKKKK